ncbi:MAG: UbiH/UbiF/VisC/COQ6 family ubiquinone biosynthesis hydroxylase [Alphaproteobacteria bacterium]
MAGGSEQPVAGQPMDGQSKTGLGDHGSMNPERSDGWDVVIVGGGLVGLTLGIALAKAKLETIVIDGLDPSTVVDAGFDGRVSAIAFASARMFKALGLWPSLEDRAQPINDILVTDGTGRRAGEAGAASLMHLHFDHRELDTGPLGFLMENRHIRMAQQTVMADCPGLHVLAPASVARVERGAQGVTAHLADGRTIKAKLCLAADGRRSFLRESAGIRTVGWQYRQTGIVTTVEHDDPHHGVAQEYFLPHGPFAILPMTGNRASLVWTEDADLAPDYMALDDARFAEEITHRFGPYLGEVRPVGPRWSYPLGFHMAERFVDDRMALVGDAAHGIHPIAGQGLNLGLRDIAALAEVLADARRLGLDPGAPTVLERYQQWRRFDTVALAAGTDVLTRLFSNDFGPLRMARDMGLAMVNAIGPARRLFMRHAGGAVAVGGEASLPRLLRGEAV